jgi:chromosome segregation ATPase
MSNEITTALAGLEARLGHRIDGLDHKIDSVASRLDAKIDTVASQLNEKIEALGRDMYGHFDSIYQRFDKLELEYQMIVAALRRIEEGMAADRVERDRIKADIASLRAKIAELDARIEALEARLDET